MAPQTSPNLFNLTGDGITVSYSTTSIDGKPRFTFTRGRLTLSFAGKEIASVPAGIGTLVSVVIAQVPDQSTTTFSVLLPAIRVTGSKRQAFRTIGITTVAATGIAGPPPGVQQKYKGSLACVARRRTSSSSEALPSVRVYRLSLRRARRWRSRRMGAASPPQDSMRSCGCVNSKTRNRGSVASAAVPARVRQRRVHFVHPRG